jgi:hypothetical protein
MIVPDEFPEQVTGSSSKVTRDAKLLMGVRKYVVENINKRLGIIMEALDISIEAGVMTRKSPFT